MEDIRKNMAASAVGTDVEQEKRWTLEKRLRPTIVAIVSVIFLFGATISGVTLLLHRDIDPDLDAIARLQETHLESYIADVEFLAHAGFFQASEPNKNANLVLSEQLNQALYWVPQISEYGRSKPLIKPATREFLLRTQGDWIKAGTYFEKGNLGADLSLFSIVATSETLETENLVWNLELSPPLLAVAKSNDLISPSKLPLPDVLDILLIIKVRLIKGTVDKEPLRALKEVRAFANLLMSAESYPLLSAGLGALDLERRAYGEYVERGWLEPKSWKPIDRNSTARAQRAAAATMGYMRALTPQPVLEQFLAMAKSKQVPPGFCAAINEQVPTELSLRKPLTGLFFLERSYREGYELLDQIALRAQEICRLEVFRSLYKKATYLEIEAEAPWPLGRLPYFRTLFALRDWSTSPKRFDAYDKVKSH